MQQAIDLIKTSHQPFLMDIIATRAKLQPDQVLITAINDNGSETTLTASALDKNARMIARELQAQQAKNKCVLLLYEQGIDYINGFMGCLYAGAIAVPVYPPLTNEMAKRLIHIIKDADIKIVLTTESLNRRLRLFKWVSPVAKVVNKLLKNHNQENTDLLSCLIDLYQLKIIRTDHVSHQAFAEYKQVYLKEDDVAYLQYTSGSTNNPKGVIVTHKNLMANIQQINQFCSLSQNDVIVSWLPIYHDMGLVTGILCPLYYGFQSVIMSPFYFLKNPLNWLKTISVYRATLTGAPDFAYRLCIKKISENEKKQLDLTKIRLMFCGAEYIHPDTFEKFYDSFKLCGLKKDIFFPTYGLAEAVVFVSGGVQNKNKIYDYYDGDQLNNKQAIRISPHQAYAKKIVSVGYSANDCIIKIIDTKSEMILQDGFIGEIVVAGPNVTQGYWCYLGHDQGQFFKIIPGYPGQKFIKTGDLGFIINDRLHITGRIKDLIIIRGLNHYPQDIEQDIEEAIAEVRLGCVAAFSVVKNQSECLIIVTELKADIKKSQLLFNRIKNDIQTIIANAHGLTAEDIIFIQPKSIPKTTSGKLRRSACAEYYLNNRLNRL